MRASETMLRAHKKIRAGGWRWAEWSWVEWSWAAVSLSLIIASPAASEDLQGAQDRLESVAQELDETRSRARTFEEEMAILSRALRGIQTRLHAAADLVQAQKDRIDALDRRLEDLEAEEKEGLRELDRRYLVLAESIAAMQRLSRKPVSALIIRPVSITETVRAAVVLDTFMPSLRERADLLRSQLEAVAALQEEISGERTAKLAEQDLLQNKRREITALLEDKEKKQASAATALKKEQRRLRKLADEADSLSALIAQLEQDASSKRPKRDSADAAGLYEGPPFSLARGAIPLPAPGEVVRLFNELDDDGLHSRGIVLKTQRSAQVISPWDGKVVFAGSFRDYGQLLIISHGEGYHTLLAGMSRINAVVAQWVLAGEPIGQMSKTENGTPERTNPLLYIELRKDGRSINPLPWLAVDERKVSG